MAPSSARHPLAKLNKRAAFALVALTFTLAFYATTTLPPPSMPHFLAPNTSHILSDQPVQYPDDSLTYRHHLETTTSPPRYSHSSTLTFTTIYVLTLSKRGDRRARMDKLARALGLKFVYFEATDKEDPVVSWIGERVYEIRERKRDWLSSKRGVDRSSIGGGGLASDWLRGSNGTGEMDLPSLEEERWGGMDWVRYLEESGGRELRPSEGFNVSQALYDPMERNERRQLKEAVISTWYGHTRLLKEVLKRGDETALVLEDDVDLEWDLERLWAAAERRLPRVSTIGRYEESS
jgi:hypothetical protein